MLCMNISGHVNCSFIGKKVSQTGVLEEKQYLRGCLHTSIIVGILCFQLHFLMNEFSITVSILNLFIIKISNEIGLLNNEIELSINEVEVKKY